ncbi:Ger(x)C family spore germination protein [Neobacillus bataviensis]|uniref:Ger(x)C family spore germination protein n=1 Tax=Neobacillus bataviensis TaxID=220685 RepID=UPI001CBAB88D|nr:Ger(x)C family spore germination C-terminal domain-containing protein [Neobacillus bataviensis]
MVNFSITFFHFRLFFDHVITFVISKQLAEHKFKEVIEEIGRNRSIRHTLRLAISEDNLGELFSTQALFQYPAIYTVMFRKNGGLYQDSIKPMLLMDFLRDYYEPMGVSKIPIVKIDKKSWKAGKKYPVLIYNGLAIFQKQKLMKNLSFKDALIMNWLFDKKVSIEESVKENGRLIAAVKLDAPKMKVNYEKGSLSPKFFIELTVKGDLLEQVEQVPLSKLTKLIEEELKRKVEDLYQEGINNKTDLLNIGEKWYRKRPKRYSELEKNDSFYLDQNSLTSIKVKAEIFHFNGYKYYKGEDILSN